MPVFGGTEAIPATMPFAPISRSTLRYNELAGTDEPRTVGVTLLYALFEYYTLHQAWFKT